MPKTKYKKRADGRYQRLLNRGRKPDGSYDRVPIYGNTITELERNYEEAKKAWEIEKAKEKEMTQYEGLKINPYMTFRELGNYFLTLPKPGKSASESDERIFRLHLCPKLGDYRICDIKKFMCNDLIVEKGATYSEKTVKDMRNVGRQIFDVAIENELLTVNPFNRIQVIGIPPKQRRPLTKDEISLIVKTWSGHRMGPAAMTMLFCGTRRGETAALNVFTDFNLNESVLSINKSIEWPSNQPDLTDPKSKAGFRDIPIPEILRPVVEFARTKNPLLCYSVQGTAITDTAFRRAWTAYENYLNVQAGGQLSTGRYVERIQVIDHITPHMLRHTYASLLYDADVDIKTAQRYLGHADIVTTLDVYIHVSHYKEGQAKKKINKYLVDLYNDSATTQSVNEYIQTLAPDFNSNHSISMKQKSHGKAR